MNNDYILNVSSSSIPSKVATVIKQRFENDYADFGDDTLVELQAIGAGAINQAMKSIVIARSFLSQIGLNVICVPAFGEFVTNRGEKMNGLRLILRLEGK